MPESSGAGQASAGKTMRVRLLSPARAAYDGPALAVVLPAFDGEWGVLPHHAPMVAALAVGCLRLTKPDGSGTAFAVCGGFAEVRDNTVTVLSPDCRGPADLTPEGIEVEFGQAAGAGGVHGEQARQEAWVKACRVVMGGSSRKSEA